VQVRASAEQPKVTRLHQRVGFGSPGVATVLGLYGHGLGGGGGQFPSILPLPFSESYYWDDHSWKGTLSPKSSNGAFLSPVEWGGACETQTPWQPPRLVSESADPRWYPTHSHMNLRLLICGGPLSSHFRLHFHARPL